MYWPRPKKRTDPMSHIRKSWFTCCAIACALAFAACTSVPRKRADTAETPVHTAGAARAEPGATVPPTSAAVASNDAAVAAPGAPQDGHVDAAPLVPELAPQRGNNGAVSHAPPARSDDAIIARRLRRAAEQASDPELKQKLWKEYLAYLHHEHTA